MSARHLTFFFDLNRAHATAIRRFDSALGAVHGIGLNDLHLLQVLDQAPDRRLRRTDLAQFAVLTDAGRQLVSNAVPTARRIAAELLDPHVSKEELTQATAVIARLA
jgi:hypothetical protein